MRRNNISASWIIGVVLLVIGARMFLERLNFHFFDLYFPWWVFSWHFVFIVIGLIIITTTSNRTTGIILMGIGFFTMLPHWFPLLFVLLGIYLLTRGNGAHFPFSMQETQTGVNPDLIEVVTVFGGCNKIYQSSNLKGGTILAAFGGSEINLQQCHLAEGINIIDATVIFGGTTIQAPADWNIQIDITPIFGGAGDKRIKGPNVNIDSTRILVLKGVAIFGGIDIKN